MSASNSVYPQDGTVRRPVSASAVNGVKQVDRLLSNHKVSPWALAKAWIRMLVGVREELLVALSRACAAR
jgi:hypothetical protein